MLNWFTYLGMALAKTYLGASVLLMVGAPLRYILANRPIMTWKDYCTSCVESFQLLALQNTDYMWAFIFVSCPVGFLLCEIMFCFNKWIGLHDDLSISDEPEQKEYFSTMIYIQRHQHLYRVYNWESFQSNLFLCVEYLLEFFLAFHLIVGLVVIMGTTTSNRIAFDSWIPMVPTLLLVFLGYLAARYARKKKYNAFGEAYQVMRDLKARDDQSEWTSSEPPIHALLQKLIEEDRKQRRKLVSKPTEHGDSTADKEGERLAGKPQAQRAIVEHKREKSKGRSVDDRQILGDTLGV